MADLTGIVAIAAGVAAVVSAVASSWSAKNSGRSASASEKSADASAKALHRAAVHELLMLCHDALIEEARIKSFAVDMRTEITTLFNLSNASGGSRETVERDALTKDLENAAEQAAEARRVSEHPDNLYVESTIYVNQVAARVVVARNQLRVTRESMERHLNDLRAKSAAERARKTA